MPDIKRTFSIAELMQDQNKSASDAHHIPQIHTQGRGEPVGRVRRDNRRLKSDTEKLIREFMQDQTEEVLLLDICDHLERRPSPIIREIVAGMVDSGELIRRVDYGAGPTLPRYLYSVAR